jgi:hypothetical protein
MTRRRPTVRTLVLFTLLSIVHTWPLASAPARLSRNDNADTILNEWIVAWVAHQAVRDPLHLVDANIFYPDRNTLAYSEYLLVPAAMGAPLVWAGRSPVLVYNVLLIAGLTLTGWAACLLISRWTGDLAAGIVGGVLIAFNAHTLTRLPQLQALHMEGLPLALLAFDALLTTPRVRHALLLALWFALQGLTSYYGTIFMTTALLVGWLARPEDWIGPRARRVLPLIALAAGVALLIILPFLLPYRRLGQVRSLNEVALYSAGWRDYLASPARVHYDLWSARWFGGTTALFPGVTSIVFAAVAIVTGAVTRDKRARMALVFGIVGIALSCGPSMPGYAVLYRLLPPLQGIRNAARFGYLAIVSSAILAGFGVAAIRQRWPQRRLRPAFAFSVILLANVDAFSAPIDYVNAERVSPLFSSLRNSDAIVAEFPFYPPDRVFHNADYMLESTYNWRPMLNGYSGLTPQSYVDHARELARFPDQHAMATLRAIGVTHIFVHDRALRDWTDDETADAVRRSPDLRLLAQDGDVALYRLIRKSDGSS